MFIQLQNITKNYKNPDGKSFIRVLKDINLNIDKGEMLAIKELLGLESQPYYILLDASIGKQPELIS